MGAPLPYQLGICSTLESRGPAALFLAVVAAVMILLPRTRRIWGWPGLVAVIAAMLLTQARTALGYLVVAVLIGAILAQRWGGRGRRFQLNVLISIVIAFGGGTKLIARFDDDQRITNRLATLNDISKDGSFQGRVRIAQEGSLSVLTHPLGFGLGGGNAVRLNNVGGDVGDAVDTSGVVGDNGYLELFSQLGLPGGSLYIVGLALLIRHLRSRIRDIGPPWREGAAIAGIALLVAVVPGLLIFNMLAGAHASYMWMFISPLMVVPLSQSSTAAFVSSETRRRSAVRNRVIRA
jgi:O-antigen ligase